jgi:hypothetical protein
MATLHVDGYEQMRRNAGAEVLARLALSLNARNRNRTVPLG